MLFKQDKAPSSSPVRTPVRSPGERRCPKSRSKKSLGGWRRPGLDGRRRFSAAVLPVELQWDADSSTGAAFPTTDERRAGGRRHVAEPPVWSSTEEGDDEGDEGDEGDESEEGDEGAGEDERDTKRVRAV